MRYSGSDVSCMHFLLIYISICGLPYVLGHGFVHNVVVGKQSYPGWNPFTDPYDPKVPPRIVRKVKDDGPVKITDLDIACNYGGNEGTSVTAKAQDGSDVKFDWAYWPQDHQGPISTYMTSCNGDCSKFGANNAKWFKVDAVGYDPSTKLWAVAKLISDGFSWNSTIPAGLKAGEYLMRHEIIALHSIGSPQFYPSCSQIKVTGSGTHVPSDSDMVTIQALYKSATFPDIYDPSFTFTIPGPPPVHFGSGGSPSPTSTTKVRDPARSSTSTTALPSKQCHIRRRTLG